jgi:hypothetical protein
LTSHIDTISIRYSYDRNTFTLPVSDDLERTIGFLDREYLIDIRPYFYRDRVRYRRSCSIVDDTAADRNTLSRYTGVLAGVPDNRPGRPVRRYTPVYRPEVPWMDPSALFPSNFMGCRSRTEPFSPNSPKNVFR